MFPCSLKSLGALTRDGVVRALKTFSKSKIEIVSGVVSSTASAESERFHFVPIALISSLESQGEARGPTNHIVRSQVLIVLTTPTI